MDHLLLAAHHVRTDPGERSIVDVRTAGCQLDGTDEWHGQRSLYITCEFARWWVATSGVVTAREWNEKGEIAPDRMDRPSLTRDQ